MLTKFFGMLFPAALFALWSTPAWSAGDIANIDNAVLVIKTKCQYTLLPKNPKDMALREVWSTFWGNGFFIAHRSKDHFDLTAGHVVDCPAKLDDDVFDENFKKEELASYKIKTELTAIFKGRKYPASILKRNLDDKGSMDLALLEVVLPKNVLHYHIPIAEADDIYDIGTPVVIRGYMPFNEGWVLRYKTAEVENVGKTLFQFNTFVYSGMSGSPVLMLIKDRYYAVGVVKSGVVSDSGGSADISFATRLKKEYFDLTKKP